MERMSGEGLVQPGDRELRQAGSAMIVSVIAWFFASLFSGTTQITLQALTYLLWLTTLLAGTKGAVALTVGLSRRRRLR